MTVSGVSGSRWGVLRSSDRGAPNLVVRRRAENKIPPVATGGLLWGWSGAFMSLFNFGYLGEEVAVQWWRKVCVSVEAAGRSSTPVRE